MNISEIGDISERDWLYPSTKQAFGACLIDFGQFISKPFFWSCEQLALQIIQPKDTRVFEVFKRCLSAVLFSILGTIALWGWLTGSALKMGGAALMGSSFLYQKGEGVEHWDQGGFSLFSFNVCMYESGLPVLLGGVLPATARIDRLSQLIQEAGSDIVVLQELALGPAETLIKTLKEQYPHFYTNIGNPGAWVQSKTIGPELFIASKAPIVSQPKFIPYIEEGSHKIGFFCLETPTCWIINAHFPEKGQEAILRQVHSEMQRLKAATGKPCLLAGDLNYRQRIPEELFYDAKANDDTPTCNHLTMFGETVPDASEIDDYVLVDRTSWEEEKMGVQQLEIVELEDSLNPWKALSDHKPIRARIWTNYIEPS